jgi:hypothetical protein
MNGEHFLFYKMTVAPALVAGATLFGRRYGDTAAGLLAGLPIVAGPILWFYALEQGPGYAAAAAVATLLGLVSLSLFALAYSWRAWSGGTLLSCLALSWLAFAAGTAVINRAIVAGAPSWPRALLYAVAALFLALRSLPPMDPPGPRGAPGNADLPLRMAAAAALVWGLTRLAQSVPPNLSGLLTPFPVASTVLAVFAHRQGAGEAAVAVLKGLLLALNAFAAFCAVLAVTVTRMPIATSFTLALAASVAVQTVVVLYRRQKSVTGS